MAARLYTGPVDESEYERRAADTFVALIDLFEDVDPDEVDVETTGDVITLAFAAGGRVVINTQRPARQIWLAGGKSAWHFSYDAASGDWLDDKGRGDELFDTVRKLTREGAGVELPR